MSFFGQNNASGAGTSSFGTGGGAFGSAFSAATPAAGATGATTPNLFGNTAASGTTSTTGTTTNLFGGGGGGNAFGAGASGTSAFGSGAPATGGLFGASSTNAGTPATGSGAPATGTGLFGASAASTGTGLFGTKPAASTPAAAAPPGGLFGSNPTATTTTAAPTTNLFGATTGATTPATTNLFGAAKPAEAPKPSPLFGAAATNASTPAASAGLFGAKPAEATTVAAPAAPTTGLFGGLKKPDAPATSAAAATPAAPAASGSSLFGSFGTAAKPEEKKDAPAGTAVTTTNTSLTTAPAALPSVLRGKSVDEIVSKWAADLDNHVREFNTYANEIASWDRALIQNGNNLAALYNMVLAAEREQNEIDQALDHIEQQQRDISSTLDIYEKSADEVLGGQGGSLRALDSGPADTERDKNYVLATELHSQLQDLSGSLTQMIDSVNALSATDEATTEDPMNQIVGILSSHLESLQWIDGSVRDIETKVGDVEKRVREAGGVNGHGPPSRSGFGLR